MENRIHRIHLSNRRLDPAEAELEITVYPEHVTSTTQVRGRLILMPTLNQPACKAATRLSPLDGKNMNRAFPAGPTAASPR